MCLNFWKHWSTEQTYTYRNKVNLTECKRLPTGPCPPQALSRYWERHGARLTFEDFQLFNRLKFDFVKPAIGTRGWLFLANLLTHQILRREPLDWLKGAPSCSCCCSCCYFCCCPQGNRLFGLHGGSVNLHREIVISLQICQNVIFVFWNLFWVNELSFTTWIMIHFWNYPLFSQIN